MASDSWKRALLAVLVVVLAVLLVRAWFAAPAAPGALVRSPAGVRGGTARTAPTEAPDVRLEALGADRPRPRDVDRNLFRFGGSRRAAGASLPAPDTAQAPPPSLQPPMPSAPPIALKFIGIVEAPEEAKRIAVLSDGRGVYHGREGDTIEGRYRILKIGAESIELAQIDGGARQTLRLSGS
jgi:hypothetical protein